MKRFIAIMILCMLLCSCDTPTQDVPERTQQFGSASNSAAAVSEGPVVTESSSATESPTITGSPVPTKSAGNQTKEKSVFVLDESGQRRELKLGDVDVGDRGVDFIFSDVTSLYSQTENGHYYYMRSNGEGDYQIYKDNGKKVAFFSIKKGFVDSFVVYKNKFYAIIKESHFRSKDTFKGAGMYCYNPRKKKMVKISENYSDLRDLFKKNYPLFIYRDAYYIYNEKRRKILKYDLKKGILTEVQSLKHSPKSCYNWICVDNKIYYAAEDGAEKVICSLDLKNGEELEVFRYEGGNSAEEFDIELDIDEEFIYCEDYLIPRKGGKMVEALKGAWDMERTPPYARNKKYIFYIEHNTRHAIHRLNKSTLEDIVINDIRAMDVMCAKDGLYVQQYVYELSLDEDGEVDFEQERDNSKSCNLYYMDFNGENVKQIWKGSE